MIVMTMMGLIMHTSSGEKRKFLWKCPWQLTNDKWQIMMTMMGQIKHTNSGEKAEHIVSADVDDCYAKW